MSDENTGRDPAPSSGWSGAGGDHDDPWVPRERRAGQGGVAPEGPQGPGPGSAGAPPYAAGWGHGYGSGYPGTGYGTPGYGTPGYDAPGYGTPGYDAPGYGAYAAPGGYGTSGYGGGWGAPGQAAYAGPGGTDVGGAPRRSRAPGLGVLVVLAVVIALIAGGLGAVGATLAGEDDSGPVLDGDASLGAPPESSTQRPPDSVAGISNRVLPSVVSINVSGSDGEGTGSGFVIRKDGYILTNNHVVTGSGGDIRVVFNDERSVQAEVVGADASYDLAVLKVNGRDLPAATLGNSDDVVVGDPVVAIGSPLGLSGTVTSGIVSAVNRPVTAGEGGSGESSYISAIQTDAAVNPGNSGGPLVNGQGEVVGINSAIASLGAGLGGQTGSIGLGFAIPVNQARRVAEQLIRTGEATHPIIGATLDLRFRGDGARVLENPPGDSASVLEGGPAAEAGLRGGDVVTGFDGDRVTSAEELITAIRSRAPGDEVQLTYRRDGQERTVSLTLAEGE
jgi:putative serine protease PepD